MATEKEGRQILGEDLWKELGTSLVSVLVKGRASHMEIRKFWTSSMHNKLVIQNRSGTRKWLPEGSGRTPVLDDFLEFRKGYAGAFQAFESSRLSSSELRSIKQQQSRIQDAKLATEKLLKEAADEEKQKQSVEAKKAGASGVNKAKGVEGKKGEASGVKKAEGMMDTPVKNVQAAEDADKCSEDGNERAFETERKP